MCDSCPPGLIEATAAEANTAKKASDAEAEVKRMESLIKSLEQRKDGSPNPSLNLTTLNGKKAELEVAQKVWDEAANVHMNAMQEMGGALAGTSAIVKNNTAVVSSDDPAWTKLSATTVRNTIMTEYQIHLIVSCATL